MLIAVVSDIHGNRHAYEAVLDAAANVGVKQIWCLGDIVGYGAYPNACIELTKKYADVVLAGNHDLAACGKLSTKEFSAGASFAADWTKTSLKEDNLNYLKELAPEAQAKGIGLYHASPRDPVWEYVVSALQAELCLDQQKSRISLVGHSHIALQFHREPGEPASGGTCEASDVHEVSGGEWIINPGSVGQPRDGNPKASWLLLDLIGQLAIWQRTPYDIDGAAKAIRAAGLPESLAERLYHGQ